MYSKYLLNIKFYTVSYSTKNLNGYAWKTSALELRRKVGNYL